jgi:hypothetical protein
MRERPRRGAAWGRGLDGRQIELDYSGNAVMLPELQRAEDPRASSHELAPAPAT